MKVGVTQREREIMTLSDELKAMTKKRRSFRRALLQLIAWIVRCHKSKLTWEEKHRYIFEMWDVERGDDMLRRFSMRLEWTNPKVSVETDVKSFVEAVMALKMAVLLIEP